MLDFQDKSVIVVGGSSGIGLGIAQAFCAAGAAVTVWGTKEQASDYPHAAAMAGLTYVCCNANDADAVAAVPWPQEQLDVLVLAQGTVLYGREEFAIPGFEHVLSTNLTSLMRCALRFKPQLVAARGSVITLSSTAAFHATRGNPAYAASKAGLVGLTRTLGQAWAGEGVRVNGIAPGLVATKLTAVTTDNPDRLAASLRQIPLGRLGTPGDMAGAALFLASPLASYITGQTLIVDGGLTL
jgi:3-oxoacyl-[acyl-carrier protein] reductase